MTRVVVYDGRFLTDGWLRVCLMEEFWWGWCPDLQKEEMKEVRKVLSYKEEGSKKGTWRKKGGWKTQKIFEKEESLKET